MAGNSSLRLGDPTPYAGRGPRVVEGHSDLGSGAHNSSLWLSKGDTLAVLQSRPFYVIRSVDFLNNFCSPLVTSAATLLP